MKPALYSDYVADLQLLFNEIDGSPENFRSFDLHIDLKHQGLLFVYETRRKQGQTDSIYYARMARTGESKQVSQATAAKAINAFFGLGPFVAVTGDLVEAGKEASAEFDYPSCAIAFTYRRTGMEKAASMKMIFLGLGGEGDGSAPDDGTANGFKLVASRPLQAERVWEWK